MTISEVDLLELAAEYPILTDALKQVLKLRRNEDPLNVPLEPLDWRRGKLHVFRPDSVSEVEDELDVNVIKLKLPAVGIDDQGAKFLARRGDYLVRYNDNTYGVIKDRA